MYGIALLTNAAGAVAALASTACLAHRCSLSCTIFTPLNKVVVGAPSAAAAPGCVFAKVAAQLSAIGPLELLDDELLEELAELVLLEELDVIDELDELDDELVGELVELELLEALEVEDEEFAELVLFEELDMEDEELLDALAVCAEVSCSVSSPVLHAEMNKQRLVNKLRKL